VWETELKLSRSAVQTAHLLRSCHHHAIEDCAVRVLDRIVPQVDCDEFDGRVVRHVALATQFLAVAAVHFDPKLVGHGKASCRSADERSAAALTRRTVIRRGG